MAHLTSSIFSVDAECADRGQILLIAAFALAVIFIGLALVVNSAIFTENLASQGESSGASALLELRSTIDSTAGDALDYVNMHSEHSDLESDFSSNVEEIELQFRNYTLISGGNLSLSYTGDSTRGTLINDSGKNASNFTAADGDSDWRLASSINRTRAMTFHITSLPSTFSNAFEVNASIPSVSYWRLRIWEDSGEPTLRVETSTGASSTCSLSGVPYPITLDVMSARFGDLHCQALVDIPFRETVPVEYSLDYYNSDTIQGRYSLVILEADLVDHYGSDPSHPSDHEALYSANITVRYRTDKLTFEDEVRVAPGESDG